jgi:DNA polymerase I-like protein with 3'-5' exonuclease and polymerase domains
MLPSGYGNPAGTFGPSCWLRSLIRPAPGHAVAYVDWSGQEYGIAAALSGDATMQADYQSGDPYLAFGKRIGAVPADATKRTHAQDRDRLKVCCGLGAMYGAGSATVAGTLGIPEWKAREWLRAHRETYATYWRWSDAVADEAMLTGQMRTVFGWTLHVGADVNPRSLRNFPMQAHGGEMMRLAACLLTERGMQVCCPVHDAFLLEDAAEEIERTVAAAQEAMQEASEIVLPGFPLRTDAKIVSYPDRYSDPRGRCLWDTIQTLLTEDTEGVTDDTSRGITGNTQRVSPATPLPLFLSLFLLLCSFF